MFWFEMTEKAKTPDETNWQYVDIYVFSNGQQASPPRKYHLSNAELNSWTNTLKALALSQYEKIFSSIDLYTIDGQQVFTPMQVSHGSAYVAVPPHDAFITAGYDEYLLKASKSQERRKSRNYSIIEQPINKDEDTRTQRKNQNGLDMNILEQERKIIAKPAPTIISPKPQVLLQKRDNTKISEKGQCCTKPTVAKNSLPVRRTTVKSRDTLFKKNFKTNTRNGLAGKTNDSINLIRPKAKLNTNTRKTKDEESSAEIPIILATIDENVQTNFILSNDSKRNLIPEKDITGNPEFENAILVDDKDLIVVKYPDSDMTSLLLVKDQNASFKYTVLPSTDSSGHNTPEKMGMDSVKNNNFQKINKIEEHANTNKNHVYDNKYITANSERENKLKPSNNIPDNSLSTLNDKKDVINLNLKIDLRTSDGLVVTQCGTNRTKFHCLINKCSETTTDQDVFINCSTNECGFDTVKSYEQNPNFVVMHCACCNHHCSKDMPHKITMTKEKLEGKDFVLPLPNPDLKEKDERNNGNNKTPEATNMNKNSTENPVKKVNAIHIIETLQNSHKSHTASPKVVTDHGCKEQMSNQTNRQHNMAIPSAKHIITSDDQKEIQKPNLLNSRNAVRNPHLSNNYAQTDWCSMLLEARLHENGFYSFYLPSLQMLKLYGL